MRIFTKPRFLALLVSAAVLAGIAIPLSNYMSEPKDVDPQLKDVDVLPEQFDFDLRTQPLVAVLGVPKTEPRKSDQT